MLLQVSRGRHEEIDTILQGSKSDVALPTQQRSDTLAAGARRCRTACVVMVHHELLGEAVGRHPADRARSTLCRELSRIPALRHIELPLNMKGV